MLNSYSFAQVRSITLKSLVSYVYFAHVVALGRTISWVMAAASFGAAPVSGFFSIAIVKGTVTSMGSGRLMSVISFFTCA